jgi:hypothetical protein
VFRELSVVEQRDQAVSVVTGGGLPERPGMTTVCTVSA